MSNYDTIFNNDLDIEGKKITPVPAEPAKNDVDLDNTLYSNIVEAGLSSQLDLQQIDSLTQKANDRNMLYNMLDSMAEDSTISAVLEIYAEDSTEKNPSEDIVWVESTDSDIAKCVQFYLDSLNVNKNIFKWVYSLCKYGDVYLRLYRDSEYEDELFPNKQKPLNEDVKIKAYAKNDKYARYMEMVANPAEMFELTRFGKTVGYISAPPDTPALMKDENPSMLLSYNYQFKKDDITIYPATEFVHAALESDTDRVEETVDIFLNDNDYNAKENPFSYKVRRGTSLLADAYKTWRSLSLLEASVLLNRITKSSIIRLVQVEVGDMPKENVPKTLMKVKNLMEQKAALNKNIAMQDYTNPGPVENNVYIPTHGGNGAITTSTVGGDVDVKSLADLEYYQNKLLGSLRIPKQYLNLLDDNAGFSGGTSLSIISSRYAKMIKRIQNTAIQMLTDAVNLMLIDAELDGYVGKFTLHMLSPTTQEEIDRQENLSSKIQLTQDVMNMMSDIDDDVLKTKILQVLLSDALDNPELIDLLQQHLDEMEEAQSEGEDMTSSEESEEGKELPDRSSVIPRREPPMPMPSLGAEETEETTEIEEPVETAVLPTPGDLGLNTEEETEQ